MALFHPDVECPLCGKPLGQNKEKTIGFPFLDSSNPLIKPFDDGCVHIDCLSNWEDRDNFVKASSVNSLCVASTTYL